MSLTTRAKVIGGFAGLLLCVLFVLFLPLSGRVSQKYVIKERTRQLREWHERITRFIHEEGRKPITLHEIDYWGLVQVYKVYRWEPYNTDLYEKLKNREYFEETVEYAFAGYGKGWCVLELETEANYKYRLMIDSKGQIYKVSPLKTKDWPELTETSSEEEN